jgi:thiamine pyrophosphate-dependent acetolactate synthase large subunit-like protein
LSWEA